MKIVVLYTQMWNIISNRLRESVPAGRRKLRREFRLPIVYNFLQLSTYLCHAGESDKQDS